jgi:hypothetical protein
MTKREPETANIEAVMRDITATVSRLTKENALDDADHIDDEIVTTFLDSIELDDRAADELWGQLPLTNVDGRDLEALAQQLTGRIDSRSPEVTTKERGVVEESSRSVRMARKLRGPRHPFE